MNNNRLNKPSKEDYHTILKLYSNQQWLTGKEEELFELIGLCEVETEKDLLFSLLSEFRFITHSFYTHLLKELAAYITDETGFSEETTQIVACTRDEEADSGQRVLDEIKLYLFQRGWKNFKTVNRTGNAVSHHRKGFTQLVLVDDFIGSGKTLKNRIRQLESNITNHFDLKCCFLVGMSHAVESIKKSSYDVFCPLQLDRGITDMFGHSDDDLVSAIMNMRSLEKRLAPIIGEKDLRDYYFGYERTEALCSFEGGNTPNNVFPIFWWPKDSGNRGRRSLLARYERGFLECRGLGRPISAFYQTFTKALPVYTLTHFSGDIE